MRREVSGDPLLSYAEIAELAHISAATVRRYRSIGLLPEPDVALAADRPRWRTSTITRWLERRPGRGSPGKPRKR